MIILDSTLREGEQTPHVSFSLNEKIRIAKMLDEFGIEMIEAGHPSVSPQVEQVVRKIASEGLRAEIIAHVRAIRSDIDTAINCDVDRIVIFFPTSAIHLKDKLKLNQEQALEKFVKEIEYARSHGIKIRFTPEDSTRTSIDFLITSCKEAVSAGADRISIADTVGIASPSSFANLIEIINQNVDAKIDVHCHNDLGLGLANAMAAVQAGAECVHTTVNGLGERCGIVDLASLCLTSSLLFNQQNNYKIDMLKDISEYIEKVSGIRVAKNAPVIGEYAFTHKSGVHTDGILKNPKTYEPYDPSIIGRKRGIVIDKYTGKLAVQKKLLDYGIKTNKNQLIKIVMKVKDLADETHLINDFSILEIANQILNLDNATVTGY